MSASLPPCPSTFKGSQAGHPCFWRAGNRSVGMDGMSPTRAGEGKRCRQGAEQPAGAVAQPEQQWSQSDEPDNLLSRLRQRPALAV